MKKAIALCMGLFACALVYGASGDPSPTPEALPPADVQEQPIRARRPLSLGLNALGETPWIGVMAEMDPLPYLGLSLGWGYLWLDTLSGNEMPIALRGYFLKGAFSPYLEAGLNFVSIDFKSSNALFNSTFQGTQIFLGAGGEYRWNNGMSARAALLRYLPAGLWAPALGVGYAFTLR